MDVQIEQPNRLPTTIDYQHLFWYRLKLGDKLQLITWKLQYKHLKLFKQRYSDFLLIDSSEDLHVTSLAEFKVQKISIRHVVSLQWMLILYWILYFRYFNVLYHMLKKEKFWLAHFSCCSFLFCLTLFNFFE